MSNAIPDTTCRRCKTPLDAGDNYCRRCGTPTSGSARLSRMAEAAWWESPWVVLTLLFLVLGPLAFPLLWRSQRFTRSWKITLSVVVVGYTVLLVWHAWWSVNQALAPLLLEAERARGF